MSEEKKAPVTYRCDGCGKTEPCCVYPSGHIDKPFDWFQRSSEALGRDAFACSRECCNRVNGLTKEDRGNLGRILG